MAIALAASGAPMVEPPYRILCLDTVHFAGDAVAVVVAETRAAAIEGENAPLGREFLQITSFARATPRLFEVA